MVEIVNISTILGLTWTQNSHIPCDVVEMRRETTMFQSVWTGDDRV